MVADLPPMEKPPPHVCEGCILGKMHRFSFARSSFRATQKLQVVHSDVCGPMNVKSLGGHYYFVTFIDDFSRFTWIYALTRKSQVYDAFMAWIAMAENQSSCKLQSLRSDRGGEYMSKILNTVLQERGISHQYTCPYTPQQNGLAENKNRSHLEMARCMLKAKKLPNILRMEAIMAACHILNRCPTKALKKVTPFETWYSRKPTVAHLRTFGCIAYAHVPKEIRTKLDDKAVKCIFVGYSKESKGYRLYNPVSKKVLTSRDVIFDEKSELSLAGYESYQAPPDIFERLLPMSMDDTINTPAVGGHAQPVAPPVAAENQPMADLEMQQEVQQELDGIQEARQVPKWYTVTMRDSGLV